MLKQTFLRVRPRKRESPTRCCTADICLFLAFKSMEPADPMMGLSDCIFRAETFAGIAIAIRTLSKVGASLLHSFIRGDHLNFLRSFTEVHFNIDFFLFTNLLHSFSNSKQERFTIALRRALHLNTAKLMATMVFALLSAIPRPCKSAGNSFEMILLGKWTII